MRFWITRGGELSIREQLVRQISLAILSEDLPAGQKLPSVRALARRHKIHSNTVSAAYHELLDRGWVELRRGSGMYIRPLQRKEDDLQSILAACLQAAGRHGYQPQEVLHRLEQMVRPVAYEGIFVSEPEPALKAILETELGEHLPVVRENGPKALLVALSRRAVEDSRCVRLKLRSIPTELQGQPRPPAGWLIGIVSESTEVRTWAHAMLAAVGLDPECLCEIDSASPGWQDRLALQSLIITDVVTASKIPPSLPVRVFRIIADSSFTELRELVTPPKASQSAL